MPPRLTASLLITLVIIIGAVLGVGYLSERFAPAPTAETAAPLTEPVYNQIAFIGNDDNVWLVSPEGENLRQVTEDAQNYRFPTWSPDGRSLAFLGPNESGFPALYVSPTAESDPAILFEEAGSAPFYLYWVPDSRSITFLTQDRSGMSMRQAPLDPTQEIDIVARGNPFYWVWSPESDRLLMHVGGSRATSENAHITIFQNGEREELDSAPGRFQAPHWASDGSHIFYIAADDAGDEAIYKADAETLEESLISALDGFSFMVLSPTDDHVAYLQMEDSEFPPFGAAYIVDADGTNRTRITERPIGSLFWSPDGRKLALLSFAQSDDGSTAQGAKLAAPLPQGNINLRWWIYHVESGELEALTSFSPTRDFLQTVPFFDQYSLSMTYWSPDSRYFLVSKEGPNGEDGVIWVMDTMGEENPRQVGQGKLAVWSWQ